MYKKIGYFCLALIIAIPIALVALITSEFNSSVSQYDKIDYAIVLGAGLEGDKVSKRLEIRLKGAIKELKGNNIPIIVSGGQGEDELISEAQAMCNYLVENGISEDRIIIEDQSTSTRENIALSNRLIARSNANVVIFTSDYHMYRSKLFGKRIGWQVSGYACQNSWSARFKYMKREVVALARDIVIH